MVAIESTPEMATAVYATMSRLDQVVAMHRRRHCDLVAPRLHELQQAGLPQDVLKDDAVGAGQEVAMARFELLVFGVVEMAEQDLVGEGQGPLQSAADYRKVARHGCVDCSGHFRG